MPDFTFFEVHFHEFNPTNTAPLIGRGGASHEAGRGGGTPDPDLDDVPIEEAEVGGDGDTEGGTCAETADDGSGGPGLGLVALSLVLAVAATVAARKLFGGDDELEELAEIDDVA